MTEKILNNFVLIGNNVWHNLLLLTVDKKLNNLTEVTGKNEIDRSFIFLDSDEFEKAVEKHIFAKLFFVVGLV